MQIQKYQSFRWSWMLAVVAGLALLVLGAQVKEVTYFTDMITTGLFTGGGLLVMVGLIFTLPSSNTLEIAEEGFSYRAGWRRIFCRWDQCSEFSRQEKNLLGLTANELVTFNSDAPAPSHSLVLPGTFGLSADDLARNMNDFRQMQLKRLQKPAQTFL